MWRHYLAQMVKLADTLVSGTSAARLGGSSPPLGKGNGEYPAGYSFFLDRGLEPEPAPSGSEEKAPGWRRQQALSKLLVAVIHHSLWGPQNFGIDDSPLKW